jgi:hypothetical protein
VPKAILTKARPPCEGDEVMVEHSCDQCKLNIGIGKKDHEDSFEPIVPHKVLSIACFDNQPPYNETIIM